MCTFHNIQATHLLLLHELRVRAVIDDTSTENRRGKLSVDLFGVHVLELAIEDELIALRSKVYSRLLSEENEGEDVAILLELA
jgi:hypothetical protein